MSSLTVPIPPDLSPACRAGNTDLGTVPMPDMPEFTGDELISPAWGSPARTSQPAPPRQDRLVGDHLAADRSTSWRPSGDATSTACPASPTDASAGHGQHAYQAGHDRSIDPGQPRPVDLTTQHRDLMPQDQDLHVLGCGGSGEQPQPTHHLTEDQIQQPQDHSRRSPTTGTSRKTSRSVPHAGY